MEVFIFTVILPENPDHERVIKDVDTSKGRDPLFWTEKELDMKFSGEFSWRKVASNYGVCAIQYVNLSTVRLIIAAGNRQQADSMLRTFTAHLSPKKTHKTKYARRAPSRNKMLTINSIAENHSLAIR